MPCRAMSPLTIITSPGAICAAESWASRISAWLMTQDVSTLGQWYNLDGTLYDGHDNPGNHTAITMGPWAVAAMAHSQEAVDALGAELLNIPASAGTYDAEYFPRCLRALALVALTGRSTVCGGAPAE